MLTRRLIAQSGRNPGHPRPARHAMTLEPTFTDLLHGLEPGDERAVNRVLPLVYEQLRQLAHQQLRGESTGHTLGTTALVHEAYLRLVDQRTTNWQGRVHFLAIAARAMRRLLIDHARRRNAAKRGGGARHLDADILELPAEERAALLIELDAALEQLSAREPRQARVVECRFFGGMTEEETAAALGITDRTVRRDWVKARAWLHVRLADTVEVADA